MASSNYIEEPLTIDSADRLCLQPIQHDDLYKNYLAQFGRFWAPSSIDLSKDAKSWNEEMTPDERHYISTILAFFANADNAVLQKVMGWFAKVITLPEALLGFSAQSFFEGIHIITYNMMIDAVIRDPVEKLKLFQAVKYNPIIAKKIAWLEKWGSDCTINHLQRHFVVQCFYEGVGFASSFAGLFWLRKQQKCPGICYGNEKIVPDESLHVEQFALLASKCVNHMDKEEIYVICKEIVSIEDEFVDDSLPKDLKGMNSALMKQHVRHVADVILDMLHVDPLYNVRCPFDFMDGFGLIGKTNFFEKRTGEYLQKGREIGIYQQFENLGDDLDF